MLDKRSKYIVWIFGVFLVVVLFAEIIRPTPVNWNPSYTAQDKIPFGAYVLYEELPNLFPEATIETVSEDPFEFLQDSTMYGTNNAYIFIDTDIGFDEQQRNKLKSFVANGNTVFISSNYIFFESNDSTTTRASTNYKPLETKIQANLFTTSYQPDSLPTFSKGTAFSSFYRVDTTNTRALGYFKFGKTEGFSYEEEIRDSINFVEMDYGKGKFLFHSVPEAFTNYYMLKGNSQYAATVLAYIEADTLYLDAFKKTGKKVVSSPMRFIFNQSSLTWAYYLLLGGLLLFVIFRGKREQRIIPVVTPLENTSIEFTKTIGDLYFQHKDYGNIIAKKITYFLDTIRSKYFMNTTELDTEFINRLAAKTGHSVKETQELIQFIKHQKGKPLHTEADLIALHKKIEAYRL